MAKVDYIETVYCEEVLGPTVTRKVAARILKCSPTTITRMCRDGRLAASQAGVGTRRVHLRIKTADLLAYAKLAG